MQLKHKKQLPVSRTYRKHFIIGYLECKLGDENHEPPYGLPAFCPVDLWNREAIKIEEWPGCVTTPRSIAAILGHHLYNA